MIALVSAAALVLGLLGPAPAVAVHDTEPPQLSTPVKPRFVVGTVLRQFRDNEEGHAFYDVAMRLSWEATDNVDTGLNFDVWRHPQGNAPERIGDFITATRFDVQASDYNGFFGGAALVVDHWSVQAYDDAGNSVERSVYGSGLVVTQDDGAQTYDAHTPNVRVRYTGTWNTGSCACFADRSTRWTRVEGSAVVLRVVVPDDEEVRSVGVVMDRGRERGQVRFAVDGVDGTVVDLKARKTLHRGIVWAKTLPVGVHTIRITALGTAGRPRVDFDAVVVN